LSCGKVPATRRGRTEGQTWKIHRLRTPRWGDPGHAWDSHKLKQLNASCQASSGVVDLQSTILGT